MKWLWQARMPVDGNAVHDGDTLRLELDLGFSQVGAYALRLRDVAAPELKQAGGPEALAYVQAWLAARDGDGWPFLVETFRTRTGRDLTTLERYVAVVFDNGIAAGLEPSLNAAVTSWLRGHPNWGRGIGG